MIYRMMTGVVLLVGVISCARAQGANVVTPAAGASASTPATEVKMKTYTVPVGTRIPLILKNEISTRTAMPGDAVYLVSDFPVVADGAVLLPAGMYVKGVIDRVQRAGKVKGRAQLQMHFISMILPNGVEIQLPGSLDKAPSSGGAKVKDREGTIEQAGNKGQDAQRIASNTLEGTGVGSIAGYASGNAGMGAGIGGGAGAMVGVLTTLLTRGHDVVFPQGASLEMVLDRPLELQQTQLIGMPASSGVIIPSPVTARQVPMITSKPND